MLFEVYAPFDAGRVFWTEHESCVPGKEQMQLLYEGGYRFKLNGKDFQPPNIKKKAK